MRIRPRIVDILELSKEIISNEFDDNSFDNRRYETFMMANAITIATRQIKIGVDPERKELKKLLNLTKSSASLKASIGDRLADLYSHVCLEIRKGNFDPDTKNHKELRNILDEAALQLVMEYNPKYLGENRNK